MGMAASQARYLALTARKSNVEFQGQQINQQRTRLAVEQTELFNELMELRNPTPPSVENYTKSVYSFDAVDSSSSSTTITYRIDEATIKETSSGSNKYTMTVEWDKDKGSYSTTMEGELQKQGSDYYKTFIIDNAGSAPISTPLTTTVAHGQWEDEKAYQDAMNQYNYQHTVYAKRIEEINARAEKIQIEDRTLELKLRNLDTEQNALQTELESVKKVIQDTIDKVFKTFQS